MDTLTVKLPLLVAVVPPTVTFILPLVAPAGTVVTSCVEVAEVTTAAVPLKETPSLAGVELKFVPVIVTEVPTAPLVGVKLEIVGAGVATEKLLALVAVKPFTVTVTGPVLAPAGTAVTSFVDVADVTVATVPLNLTVLLVLVVLNFVPVMVTDVPT
jgi:hypothetical protein